MNYRVLYRVFISPVLLWTPITSTAFPVGFQHRPKHHRRQHSTTDESSEDLEWGSDAYWLNQIHKQAEKRPEYQWFQNRSSLPFDCTACGKCCKTQGQVYMTPEEHGEAAELLGISKEEFLQKYASHTLVDETNGESWVRLIDQSSDTDHGCIFLQKDNTCQIYEARPIQCSTYPFWPNILASKAAWNAEVRRADDEEDSDLPVWSSEDGGCEGMLLVRDDDDDEPDENGVPIPRVYEQAYFYEHDERRFPRGQEIPVERTGPKRER
jgi:uncharacterized protein